jgi:O-antigen ligase
MLLVARAYWTSEAARGEVESGNGLYWILSVLVVAGVAIASFLVSGKTRIRWSWADVAVYALMILVGFSSTRGADRRMAINLAWEWGGLGVAYALVRILPRTRAESSALAGALLATAVAISAYGLYQVKVEFPEMHALYLKDPEAVLRQQGIDPKSPQRALFENRLLYSNEVFATFALANSLAGFLVGPMVVCLAMGLETLRTRGSSGGKNEGRGSLWAALVFAALPALVLLACLILTKSRSAYLGLAVGLAVLAWRQKGQLSARTLGLAGGALVVVLGLFVAGAATTRHLDLLVLTESTKSLRYRGEYWQGAWQVITREPGVFWYGLGPGNFAGPYLKYKLPASSEEISDPHNLMLEVWATAGLGALLAMLAGLWLALREMLGPPRPLPGEPEEGASSAAPDGRTTSATRPTSSPADAPPARTSWLMAAAGCGWVAASLVGQLNPFRKEQADQLSRWFIFGVAWPVTVLIAMPLWRRVKLPAAGLAAAVVAMVVHLLAAGGIGVPAVALMLWMLVALGQNLREDRSCGRLRVLGGRGAAFLLGLALAALLGSYFGAIEPFWESKQAMEEAEGILRVRVPQENAAEQIQRARDSYSRAGALDRFSARPLLALADLEYEDWLRQGGRPDSQLWRLIMPTLDSALKPPRNPASLLIQRRRAAFARELLARIGSQLSPADVIQLEAKIVQSTRLATQLYPSSAQLHAELAEASATLGDVPSAAEEAREALRLDQLTPHADKKLSEPVRKRLSEQLPKWQRKPRPPAEDGNAGQGNAQGSSAEARVPRRGSGTRPSTASVKRPQGPASALLAVSCSGEPAGLRRPWRSP